MEPERNRVHWGSGWLAMDPQAGTEHNEGQMNGDLGGQAAHTGDPWQTIRDVLRAEFGERTFESWLKPISYVGVEGSDVLLSLPTHFMCDWVKSHFAERLRALWAFYVPGIRSVRLVVAPAMRAESPAPVFPANDSHANDVVVPGDASIDEPELGARLEERFTFERFVIGKSNEFAYNAARRMAEGGPINFNPLFLHGGVGLGKTHLMHAIGWAVRQQKADAKVVYLSAEKFMVAFLAALRHKDTISFKQRFRSVDVLMIDDVQFIAGKESTQEEFFHTMNALIEDGKRLVISADRSPYDLEGIEERVRSRLQWGLVADINPTDYELRLNILHSKAEAMPGVMVSHDVLDFLARKIVSNVRELEGTLNRVAAHASLIGHPITLDFARQVLADVLRANDRKITIDDIQRKVADYYKVKLSDLLSARRARDIARPRQVAMFLAKKLTPRSLPEIGRKFGGRDHTTVMHAVKRIEELRTTDSELEADIDRLSRLIDG